jgi:hypothetical protein
VRRHPGEELAGLLGQVQQDGARFEQRQRLAAGAVGIDDGRNLVVRFSDRNSGDIWSLVSKLTRWAS